ncbi:MAG TPA: cyclic nucleotide-binding domain-containing protein [Anaeromyxobacter sp.]|nr:cyclic nucleotide-binding domain-containing protein [Anaeromyxobacter sp.]
MADVRELKDRAAELAGKGKLIQAIAVAKAIPPRDPGHAEAHAALAALYARRAAVDAEGPPAREAPTPEAVPAPSRPAGARTGLARIVSAAGAAAAGDLDVEIVEARPAAGSLPRVPIFSDLPPDAFVALARAMELRTVAKGEPVLEEGGSGASFYVVATGRLAVSRRDDAGRPVVLARLGEGDFFGEMALLSGAPRAATVTAEEACELLEFAPEALLEVARGHPPLATSLRRFYRRRLLANAMATSPVFRPLGPEDRARAMARFRARAVADGERIVLEGEPSDGLYVVLDGALDVSKRRAGAEVAVGRLREGDVFGEMSLLRAAPASATVVVRRGGTLLRLPRADFDALVAAHPPVRERMAELADERAESLDAILSGHAQWTEDGLVLI